MSAKRKGRSKVTIFPDWCKGCGICAAFCPSKVMELNDQGKAVVVREEECIHCGFCELHCPDFAIMVQPKEDDEVCTPKSSGKKSAKKEEQSSGSGTEASEKETPAQEKGEG